MLELAEVPLDDVALAVDRRVDGALDLAVALGRDVGAAAPGFDQVDDGAGVVAPVGDQRPCGFEAVDQGLDGGLVGRLPRRQDDPQRQAVLIDQGVDLGAQSSTRTADGVIRAPFFPPAACWWARMMELSIRCIDPGEAADRASNTRTQTPALAQRLNRL